MHAVALAQSIMASPHRGDESKAEGGEIQEKECGENESRVDGGGAVCAKSGGNISEPNTIVELFSQPCHQLRDLAEPQAGDILSDESNCNVIEQDILLHAKLVLCDGHRIDDEQKRDAKHLAAGDIFLEALKCKAHLKMHLYLKRGIEAVTLDDFLVSAGLDLGIQLLSESQAERIWELAFCSANYVPTTDARVLDSHLCPVFSRQWIQHRGMVFGEVITAERQRVINRLEEKLASAQTKAAAAQDAEEGRFILALHQLAADRAHAFIDMHAKFAEKNLAVFETPRLGSCGAFTLHWLKSGALPDPQYQDDEGENTPGGLAIVRAQRESVSRSWEENCKKRSIQQAFVFWVEPPMKSRVPHTSSSSTRSAMLDLPSSDLVASAGVIDVEFDATRGSIGGSGDHASKHVMAESSSGCRGSCPAGDAPTGSSSLPGSPHTSPASAASNPSAQQDPTQWARPSGQPSAPGNAPDSGGFETAELNMQLVPHRLDLPTESLPLVNQYYAKIKRYCQDDASALWIELVAFLTACHQGMLQKFALPGIPDWMAFMSSVSLMLRVVGVLVDEPILFPISKELASAFALSTLLCVGIRGAVGQYMVAAFVSDHSDRLRSACSHLRDAEGDAKGMSGAARFLFEFLESLIDEALEDEEEVGHVEGRHKFFSGIPWLKSAKEKVHALLSCMINARDLLLTIRGDASGVDKGSLFLLGVIPCLEKVFPLSETADASRYTVQFIARLMWLMLYKLSGGGVDREIGIGTFLLIRNMQSKDVIRFLPDQESLKLLTDLLSSLWPTACKVSIWTDQWPVCLWPSTLVALCEWMQQKECLSVERLLYLARHSSRHLIRDIQAQCWKKQPRLSFGRHMVQEILKRDPACQGILEQKREERRLARLSTINTAKKKESGRRKKEDHKKKTRTDQKTYEGGSKRRLSSVSNDDDSDMVAFWNSLDSEEPARHAAGPLQPAGAFGPAPHPAAECSSADVLPAAIGEPAARHPTAETRPMRRARNKKCGGQAAISTPEGKKQAVLQWLDAVKQHGCANTPCKTCGRRGNWCIVGNVSKNVFSYVAMYKNKSRISESAVNAMTKIIDARD